jgi:hypothetical protein
MAGVSTFIHRGKTIVFQDFAHVADAGEALRLIDKAREFMARQNKGVLLLTDISGSHFDRRVVEAMKELVAHHKPWVSASAVVGLSPITRIIYQMVIKLTGRAIRPFGGLEEAKDWLVAQAPAA